uniref:NADH-ubiquinone oxidoreductase chain 2 n=1 Tax=Coleoptera sp. 1 AH-2016 TaxID=1903823 RepID=A0A343C2D9_9COLE|nr:NADH dehydrogenase subunit 2 [Coleoptera sp. 1 AH-2016]
MLFINLLMTSTFISISSLTWITAWIGLEINLLTIMPLMKISLNKHSSEAMMKYFITQALASTILLLSILIFYKNSQFLENMINPSILINSSLMMKMGAAPFHFWLPEVSTGLNWKMVFTLLTWQKIAPMILLSYEFSNLYFLSMIIVSSTIIGSFYGMNQTCLRKIFTYSSINHTSWMIASIFSSMDIWLYYFLIYTTINFNIMIIFSSYKIFYTNQLNKLLSYNKTMKLLLMMNLLSLGGLPPFLGFLPKWLTINFMTMNNYYFISLILIIFSLISLYFYIRISFPSLTLNHSESLMNLPKQKNNFFLFLNIINLMSLTLIFLMMNLI